MANQSFQDRMKDYVAVNERVMQFYQDHPDGRLQSEVVALTDTYVAIKAYAYRDADDDKPCTGHSGMPIPGKTSFTKDSEIENAETSAWGRALAAMGYEVKKGIASHEEVMNKQVVAQTAREVAGELSSWLTDNDMTFSHPWVAEELGEPVTKDNVFDLLGEWLKKPGNNPQTFRSRIGARLMKAAESEVENAKEQQALAE